MKKILCQINTKMFPFIAVAFDKIKLKNSLQ